MGNLCNALGNKGGSRMLWASAFLANPSPPPSTVKYNIDLYNVRIDAHRVVLEGKGVGVACLFIPWIFHTIMERCR